MIMLEGLPNRREQYPELDEIDLWSLNHPENRDYFLSSSRSTSRRVESKTHEKRSQTTILS